MDVKNKHFIAMALQSVTLLLCLIPGYYLQSSWVPDYNAQNVATGAYTKLDETTHSLFGSLFNTNSAIQIIGVLLLLVMLACLGYIGLQRTGKVQPNRNATAILFGGQLGVFVLLTLMVSTHGIERNDYYTENSLGAIFWIFLGLMVASLLLGLLKANRALAKIEEEDE